MFEILIVKVRWCVLLRMLWIINVVIVGLVQILALNIIGA